jgi:phage-related protein
MWWMCLDMRSTWRNRVESTHRPNHSRGFGSAGVLEVVEDDDGNTYRAVYTVRFSNAVYVLHCFQKKSHKGIATPKQDLNLVHDRLKLAQQHAEGVKK